jgi:hypothetical protein
MTKPFHITIGVAVQPGASLESDIRLAKAAILYGDKATLCSLGSAMLMAVLALTGLNIHERLQFLVEVAPTLDPTVDRAGLEQRVAAYDRLRRKKHPAGREFLLCRNLEAQLDKAWGQLSDRIIEMTDRAGLDEIVSAIDSGLLTLHPLEHLADQDALLHEFFDVIAGSISNLNTYPLLDDQVGSLVAAAIREGYLEHDDIGVQRGRIVGLAAGLVEQLPLYDNATVAEVIDIRHELESPLVRFRSAIIELAGSIGNAAWDKEFPHDVEQVLRKHVEPAVLEIRDAVRTNNYLRRLAESVATRPLEVAKASGLGLVLSSIDLASEAASKALGTAVGAGVVAYGAYRDWRARQQEIESNRLFFYYKAGRLLG